MTLTRLCYGGERRVEFRWVVKGVQGFLRGFERLSPDRAMISPFCCQPIGALFETKFIR